MNRTPICTDYKIVQVNRPVVWPRDDDEVWMLNPPRRYILNSDLIQYVAPYISAISDLKGSSKYKPIRAGANFIGKRILVERHRNRGIGDLLFMTGPLNYLHHICGGSVEIDMYALSERGLVLHDHPALANKTTLTGPLHYEDLDHYAAHWFVDNVTEHNEERDQLNVYDALYRDLGVDFKTVDARFKRPSVSLTSEDYSSLDSFYFDTWKNRGFDLRRSGYYVVAPLSHALTRSAPYGVWLDVIEKLAKRRPVLIVGMIDSHVPSTDVPFSDFLSAVQALESKTGVVNLLGGTSIRLLMAIISRASYYVGLDSGPLYIAQATRTPSISLWGTHNPAVRIGYDPELMKGALYTPERCPAAPCSAYGSLPKHKCPDKENQRYCDALRFTSDEVLSKIEN